MVGDVLVVAVAVAVGVVGGVVGVVHAVVLVGPKNMRSMRSR